MCSSISNLTSELLFFRPIFFLEIKVPLNHIPIEMKKNSIGEEGGTVGSISINAGHHGGPNKQLLQLKSSRTPEVEYLKIKNVFRFIS